MAARLSVVIPSYNRQAPLMRLLESLATQSLSPSDFEVIVVLDGSTDGSAKAVTSRDWPMVTKVIEQTNAGAGAARNNGAAEATGEYLLFVDDDVVLEPGALRNHLTAVQQCGRVAVLGHLDTIWSSRGVGSTNSSIWASLTRLQDLEQIRFSWCYSGNLLVPRAEFLAVGGFNSAIRRMEDCELGYRLDLAGITFVYCRGAAGTQYNTKSTAEVLDDAATTGASAMMLFRTEPEFLEAVPRNGRPVRGRATRFFAELSTRLPIPMAAGRLAGTLPVWMPGLKPVHNAVWLRWYLLGARKVSASRAEFVAFLSRR
ncbi:MAG: glycosyltransferase family 2 protein [Dehalococcoidia bacterium]